MEQLLRIEQNNEIIHALLMEHLSELEALYEGISEHYHQFHRSIAFFPIEEKAMLLLELSRLTMSLQDLSKERIRSFMQLLESEPSSGFASILLSEIKHQPYKMFSKLQIS